LIRNILELSSLLVHCEYFNDYKKFIIELCKSFSCQIGWEIKSNEGMNYELFKYFLYCLLTLDLMTSMCRETVHLILVLMDDEDSMKIANELFLKFKAGNFILPATLKKPVEKFFKIN
jgi:hypothetical protein